MGLESSVFTFHLESYGCPGLLKQVPHKRRLEAANQIFFMQMYMQ